MKKLIASAGLVAVGTASLHAVDGYGLTRQESTKPWSIAASLRGFYDDNFAAAPKDQADDSWGIEFSPAFALNFPMEQTYIRVGYIYSLKYYFDRAGDDADHSHDFGLKVDHRFSERYRVEVADSFVYTQEPEIANDVVRTDFIRTDADVFRNRGAINFTAELTELLSVLAGYQNLWYDYKQDAADVRDEFPTTNPLGIGSRSALLDRMEHLFRLDTRWQMQEHLVGLVGYQYGIVDYTSDDLITDVLRGDDRDNTAHYFYVGANYTFSSQLAGEARAGVRYTDYDLGGDDWSPYVDLGLTYTYLPGSYVQFGFRQDHNATDVSGTGTDITTDQESSTVYGSLNHRITSHLIGRLEAHYQRGVFNGGPSDGDVDNIFLAGANLEYRINNYWSAETGYNYDRLDSDESFRS